MMSHGLPDRDVPASDRGGSNTRVDLPAGVTGSDAGADAADAGAAAGAPASSRPKLGGIARSMLVVGGAAAVGQAAIVIAAPLLARLYDPQAFGVFSVYAAVLSIMVGVASLRFDLAIPIARDASEAVQLLALSVAIAAVSSLLVALGLAAWASPAGATVVTGAPMPSLWLLPVALLVAAAAQALSSWAVYSRQFAALGRMRALQGVAQAAGQTVLGLLGAGGLGLVVGDVIGRAAGMEQLFRRLFETLRSLRPTRAGMARGARDHWGFARVMTVATLLSALSLQVPFLLIPVLFDLPSSGQFFLAYRMLVLPATLVGTAVSQVFFGEASSRRYDPSKLHDLAFNVTISLFVFSIPTYALAAAGGPTLFTAVFGSQWELAGEYARIMAPWLILWSVASPISSLLLVGRRERESLAFTAVELMARAGSLVVGGVLHSLVAGLILLSAVSVLLNISALWRFLRVASVHLGDLVRPVGRILLLTVPFVGVVILATVLMPPIIVVATTVAAWALATVVVLRRSPEPRALIAGAND
jgi:lipopolysaccharide exporter